ncbi:TIGR03943 family protein [Paenibacillus sp. sptzw28]|uniref:TIGR03943 family putative permease subunit n=1 Tax=Paenibacillus sp. sptzw28 TaxID=715179 RepID=UPI001C6E1928|nr:TIGR03943 family protein [Paenibacillus sp. sptzw28]QYR23631.1 TIGR03943 family protein [Paenibacillus sp. sptzw28]
MEDRTERRLIVHHVIRALILGSIAFYIAHLQLTNNLTLYIAPRMTIYVKLASLGLYLVAVIQIYHAFRLWNRQEEEPEEGCSCEHDPAPHSLGRNLLVYGLFVIPLAAVFFTPDTTIGSSMAANKGFNLSASSVIKQKESQSASAEVAYASASVTTNTSGAAVISTPDAGSPGQSAAKQQSPGSGDAKLEKLFPGDEFTEAYAKLGIQLYKQPVVEVKEKNYMETLTAVDLYLDNFIGKKLSIKGFVYRDDTLKENQFILGRFAVQCCTADALPYGVMVDFPEANHYDKDSWLNMTGTVSKTTYNGQEIILLKADKIEKIKPADDPYVYPDYDFG